MAIKLTRAGDLTKINWKDEPNESTPIDSGNLNKMQTNTETYVKKVEDNAEDALNDLYNDILDKITWKSKTVNLSFEQNTTIPDLKNAKEALVAFYISGTSYVTAYYPKELSGNWVNTMAKSDATTDARCAVYIDFTSGYIANTSSTFTDLSISRIFWR